MESKTINILPAATVHAIAADAAKQIGRRYAKHLGLTGTVSAHAHGRDIHFSCDFQGRDTFRITVSLNYAGGLGKSVTGFFFESQARVWVEEAIAGTLSDCRL